MRDAFARAFADCAACVPELCLIAADISPAGALVKFGENNPGRLINVGVAEQTMVGIAAGMALKGLRPFCYTIAPFALYRPFEMVRNDVALQNVSVTIVGMGAGLVYASLGSTHHAQEDIAIAAAMPNMQVLSPCDPHEVEAMVGWCASADRGPVYLRLGKAGERGLTDGAAPWEFGKLRWLRRGSDVCVLTHGAVAGLAADVAEAFAERGYSVSLIAAGTIKPLDVAGVAWVLTHHRRTIVIEEHAPQGGLSSRVQQVAGPLGVSNSLACYTLKDAFIAAYGSHADALAAHGLSVTQIMHREFGA